MLNELDILRDVSQRLEKSGIEYMLTGSMALNYYAEPRMTRDIDLVVALGAGDTQRLRQAFGTEYYVPEDEVERAVAEHGMFNLVHMESIVKVDLIVRKDEVYRRMEFDRRTPIELVGFHTWIVSKEDLILSKLTWARESRSEIQLGDVRSLLATGVDTEYLKRWAAELGVAEMLRELTGE